ncbi:hypothetical protein [Methylomonas sp. AM2-LC]|uniref:hypothetical protein n=1 Tax=Methylomonas sp. AM2-LC TaxID=3153301 RepID=UPI00326378B2
MATKLGENNVYGPYLLLQIQGVSQYLRWIAPGSFIGPGGSCRSAFRASLAPNYV